MEKENEQIGTNLTPEDLRKSQQRYEQLVNTIDGIVWEGDPYTFEYSFVSQQAEKMLGYPVERWVNEPDFWIKHIHPEDREWAVNYCALSTAQKRDHVFEYRMIAADGEVVWLRDIVTVVVEDGKPVTLRGVMVDIRESKQREEALRTSELRSQAILGAIPDLILRVRRDGTFLDFRAENTGDLALPPENILGTNLRDTPIPEPITGRMFQTIEKVIRENTVETYEYSLNLPQGIQHFESRTVKSGEDEVVSIVRNITESKRLEAKLLEREQQYRSIFESVSDGLFINDFAGNLVDFNPAAAQMHGYTVEEFRHLRQADFIHPDSYQLFIDFIQKVRHEGQFRSHAVDIRKDGSTFHVEVLGTSFMYKGEPHALAIVRDVEEGVKAYRLLEQRVEERTRELQTLLEVSRNVTSTLDIKSMLSLFTDQLKPLFDISSLAIWIQVNEEEFEYQGMLTPDGMPRRLRPSKSQAEFIHTFVNEPAVIPDVWEDTLIANSWRKGIRDLLGEIPASVGSWMGVPLLANNQKIGHLYFHHTQPGYYTEQHAQLAFAVANHVAVAIENARLFHTVQRGAEQFRAISELGHRITSILDVDELLTQTVRLIQETFGYFHVHIGLIEGDVVVFPATAGVYAPEPICSFCAPLRLRVGLDGICGWVAGTGEALMVPDLSQDPRYIRPLEAVGSGVVVPLKVKGQVIGILDVESKQLNAFDENDLAVLQLLANQVAVAIENARLYHKSQELAALQERQKLARELHDSVSQALYGIGLGAQTARTMLNLDTTQKEDLVAPVDYVLSLSEAGLAEMRALIFELRPESLEKEGLVAALTKQAAALEARHRLSVDLSLCEEPNLSLEAKEMLYRIALESMHNIVKHARASRVSVRISPTPSEVVLEISDDGAGFDPQGSFPGHLGLQSMRERAERLKGILTVESTPGQGTRVCARVPAV